MRPAVGPDDAILVERPLLHAGHECLPDAGLGTPRERMGRGIPAVEVADDRHACGVRCPDGEMHAGDAVHLTEMRAELLVGAVVRALREEVQVEIGEEEILPAIHYVHPSCVMLTPSFQIFVTWRIRSPSNSIT